MAVEAKKQQEKGVLPGGGRGGEGEEGGEGRGGGGGGEGDGSASSSDSLIDNGGVVVNSRSCSSTSKNGFTEKVVDVAVVKPVTVKGKSPEMLAAAAAAAVIEPAGGASARQGAPLGALLPRVVVTGVACGLPGQEKVFEEDNLARLLGGQGCVEKLSVGSMSALVEKNVVQVKFCLFIFLFVCGR